jgi:hypothetical protein
VDCSQYQNSRFLLRLFAVIVCGLLAIRAANAQDADGKREVDPLKRPITLSSPAPATDVKNAPHSKAAGDHGLSTLIGGLSVCVGAFLLFVWATRRTAPKGMAVLPLEVVELLGRAPLNGRQYLQLVRIGRKLVLLSVSTQHSGVIAEIDDAGEVERLAGLCQATKPQSVTNSFRAILGEYARGSLRDEPVNVPASAGGLRPNRVSAARTL